MITHRPSSFKNHLIDLKRFPCCHGIHKQSDAITRLNLSLFSIENLLRQALKDIDNPSPGYKLVITCEGSSRNANAAPQHQIHPTFPSKRKKHIPTIQQSPSPKSHLSYKVHLQNATKDVSHTNRQNPHRA